MLCLTNIPTEVMLTRGPAVVNNAVESVLHLLPELNHLCFFFTICIVDSFGDNGVQLDQAVSISNGAPQFSAESLHILAIKVHIHLA